jgi:hypothetical protein
VWGGPAKKESIVTIGLKKLLLLIAVVLFIVAGVGYGTLHFGTVSLSIVAFGLACFAGSFLAN